MLSVSSVASSNWAYPSYLSPAAQGERAGAVGTPGNNAEEAAKTGLAAERMFGAGESDKADQDVFGKVGNTGKADKTDNEDGDDKTDSDGLTEDEQREVEELKKTDRAVRQHEMQHIAVGGSLVTGGANYTYQKGPDGQQYAIGGEVSIDTSKGRTPEETLSRARRIRSAALAPADPSPQDRKVAAMAGQMEMQAMREIAQAAMEKSKGGQEGDAPPGQINGTSRGAAGGILGGGGNGAASAYRQAGSFGQNMGKNLVSVFA